MSSTDAADDRGTILRLHKDWWESNAGMDIPLMRTVFPSGDAYLMFNLNGHPYYSLAEKTKLWEYYLQRIVISMPTINIMRFTISGDMAFIASEGTFPTLHTFRDDENGELVPVGEDEPQPHAGFRPIRATEIYQRDDGDGKPEWKMWHFHCSQLPDLDAKRPSVNDTYRQRGLGYLPYAESFSVVGDA